MREGVRRGSNVTVIALVLVIIGMAIAVGGHSGSQDGPPRKDKGLVFVAGIPHGTKRQDVFIKWVAGAHHGTQEEGVFTPDGDGLEWVYAPVTYMPGQTASIEVHIPSRSVVECTILVDGKPVDNDAKRQKVKCGPSVV